MSSIPTQTQLMLPLLEILESKGGQARPREIYAELADRFALPEDARTRSIRIGQQQVNEFERRVRWTRQTAVLKGLISKGERSVWSVTDAARARLGNIRTGTVLTFAVSEQGLFIWANAEDAVAVVERESIDLICTSPPYPLLRPREYGNLPADKYVEWMLRLCEQWCALLTPTGSMMLNLGPTWKKGIPAQQLYVERLLVRLEDELGVHLLQRLDFFSPNKFPTPMPWVSKARVRVTPAVEPIVWLSPNPNAYGNNRNVARSYSEGGLRAIRAPRLTRRPSGLEFGKNSFVDRGGSIPPSLITATPTERDDVRYRKAMRDAERDPHPAMLPTSVARFGIQLATEVGHVVYDPFSGSGTVPVEAMRLGRRAIASERSRSYLEGSLLRARLAGFNLQQAS